MTLASDHDHDRSRLGDAVGVFTYADALAAGWTQGRIRTAVRTGRWRRLRRGVFITSAAADAAPPDTARGHAIDASAARAAAARDDLVVSGRSAALLHELPLMLAPPRAVELTAPRSYRDRLEGTVIRTVVTPYAAHDLVTVFGLPTTTLPRTLVDLAAQTTRMEAAVLIDQALRHHRCTSAELAEAFATRRPRYHRNAIHTLITTATPFCTTPLASAMRRDLLDHGVEEPTVDQQLVLRGIGTVTIALAWPRARVAVIDMSDPTEPITRMSESVLRATGWAVLPTTWHDVQHRPYELRERVRLALASTKDAHPRPTAA